MNVLDNPSPQFIWISFEIDTLWLVDIFYISSDL